MSRRTVIWKPAPWILGTFCTLSVSLAASEPAENGAPGLASRVPADTVFYASFDAARLVEGTCSLDLVSLLEEPDVQAFLAPMTERLPLLQSGGLRTLLDQVPLHDYLAGKVELAFRGIRLDLGGETLEISPSRPLDARTLNRLTWFVASVAAAHQTPEASQGPLTVGLDLTVVVEPGEELAAHFEQLLRDPSVQRSEVQLGGRKAEKLLLHHEHDMPGIVVPLYRVVDGNRWWLGGNPDTLAACFRGETASSLASSAPYQRFLGQVSSTEPLLVTYFNLAHALRWAQGLVPPICLEELDLLGVTAIESVGLASSFVSGGVRDSVALTFSEKPRGLLGLLDCASGGLRFLENAPAATGLYVGLKMDANRFVQRTCEVTADLFPASGAAIDRAREALSQQLGVDFFGEILPALGDEVGLYLTGPGQGSFLPDGMLMLRLGDAQKFERLLQMGMHHAESQGIKFSDLGGLPEGYHGFSARIPEAPVQPAMALNDQVLVIGLNPLSLKRSLREMAEGGSRSTIRTNPSFSAVMEGLSGSQEPGDLSLLVFADLRGSLEVAYQFLPMAAAAIAAQTDGMLDLALMPESATVTRHFSGLGIAGRSDPHGLCLDLFSPVGCPSLALLGAAVEGYAHRQPAAARRAPPVSSAPPTVTPATGRGKTLEKWFANIELATGATIQYPEKISEQLVEFTPPSGDLREMMAGLAAAAGFAFELRNMDGEWLVVVTPD